MKGRSAAEWIIGGAMLFVAVWILNRAIGGVVGGIGSMGHHAGQFIGVHTMAVDSRGNLYVSEGGGGRRSQKFVKQ